MQFDPMPPPHHTPLHLLGALPPATPVHTAGYLRPHPSPTLATLHGTVRCTFAPDLCPHPAAAQRVRAQGTWQGTHLQLAALWPEPGEPPAHGCALQARAHMMRAVRQYFEAHHFLEVHTPSLVPAPGTDPYIEAFATDFLPADPALPPLTGYLHTSPEFAMKRLLSQGAERIWQAATVWRNGEVSPTHSPEFTLLEWYRAWEPLEAILADVEALTRLMLPAGIAHLLTPEGVASTLELPKQPFGRLRMQDAFWHCCGFDLLGALDYPSLYADVCRLGLLDVAPEPPSADPRDHPGQWDMLFFDLQITHLDPYLQTLGPVFLTHWPRPLAVLARLDAQDPRCAERFELYVGGLEVANGFGELIDASEQTARFAHDLSQRRQMQRPSYPMPTHFLQALTCGMPPSVGVAMGFERMMMLRLGATHIREVFPYGLTTDPQTQEVSWA